MAANGPPGFGADSGDWTRVGDSFDPRIYHHGFLAVLVTREPPGLASESAVHPKGSRTPEDTGRLGGSFLRSLVRSRSQPRARKSASGILFFLPVSLLAPMCLYSRFPSSPSLPPFPRLPRPLTSASFVSSSYPLLSPQRVCSLIVCTSRRMSIDRIETSSSTFAVLKDVDQPLKRCVR